MSFSERNNYSHKMESYLFLLTELVIDYNAWMHVYKSIIY